MIFSVRPVAPPLAGPSYYQNEGMLYQMKSHKYSFEEKKKKGRRFSS
jgi:hypothetical protein